MTDKLKKYIKIGVIVALILFLTQGCIALNPQYAAKDAEGFYVSHYQACGPIALEKALNHVGKGTNRILRFITRKEISREIQKGGSSSRIIISLIHYEAMLITWPSEIKSILKKHGYKIIMLKNMSELRGGDTAIVLLKGNGIKREFHWSCYPLDKDIDNFYPKRTTILKIYKIVPSET